LENSKSKIEDEYYKSKKAIAEANWIFSTLHIFDNLAILANYYYWEYVF